MEQGAEKSTLGEERSLKFKIENKEIMRKFVNCDKLLEVNVDSLSNEFEKLVLHSVTSSTWSKHNSAWSSFNIFCTKFGISQNMPWSIESVRSYVTWALSEKNLKADTVESYLSSLNLAQTLAGYDSNVLQKDKCIKLLLKGAKNIQLIEKVDKSERISMNIHLLKILGHKLHHTKWDPLSKQIVWTACTTSFYSSCRMGEILSENSWYFDPCATLKWSDVKMLPENEIVLYIPYTKTAGLKGITINLFPLHNDTCPVAALKCLYEMKQEACKIVKSQPVFVFPSGKILTVKIINGLLEKLMSKFCTKEQKITCHSFRAAIPSAIASHPDKVTVNEVKEWGKWSSDSYKKYTRQEREKDRVMFYKAVNML